MFSSLFNLLKDPKSGDNDINLLLIGETGVGKSTFINSISTYFKYNSFKQAQKTRIKVLIPTKLNLVQSDKICGDLDENEIHQSGAAATQFVKVYLFPIKMQGKKFNLRVVDTPGVGDPRGIEQDNINLDNILAYLATLKKLHGICFLMKSNQTRFTKFIEYCMKQILARLDKSASNNIIFITTYSKTAQYTAGETKRDCLEPLVRDIKSRPPHVNIPLSDKNIFALDNEAFRALLEMQEGKDFDRHDMEGLEKSWRISSAACRRLLKYITGGAKTAPLKPHEVANTISINEVRFLIEQLATPIAEVSENIQDNLRLLDRHKKNLSRENQSLDELKQKLYIPCVDLEITELDQPVTVCTDTKCADIVKVKEVTQWHYRQRCHNPCYLQGIPKEMVGDPGIINCAAMNGSETCIKCECNWRVHMHIYKSTNKVEVQQEDENVKTAIKDKEDARVKIESLVQEINKKMKELENESNIISESIAKFSYFLQEHALTPFNDAYSDYIKQLIKNEKHLGKFADQTIIEKLEKLLQKHEVLQKTYQQSTEKYQSMAYSYDLTPQGIKEDINQLYNLKHMGKKIQEIITKTASSRHKETQNNFKCVVSDEIDLTKPNKSNNSSKTNETKVDDNQHKPKLEKQKLVKYSKSRNSSESDNRSTKSPEHSQAESESDYSESESDEEQLSSKEKYYSDSDDSSYKKKHKSRKYSTSSDRSTSSKYVSSEDERRRKKSSSYSDDKNSVESSASRQSKSTAKSSKSSGAKPKNVNSAKKSSKNDDERSRKITKKRHDSLERPSKTRHHDDKSKKSGSKKRHDSLERHSKTRDRDYKRTSRRSDDATEETKRRESRRKKSEERNRNNSYSDDQKRETSPEVKKKHRSDSRKSKTEMKSKDRKTKKSRKVSEEDSGNEKRKKVTSDSEKSEINEKEYEYVRHEE